MAFTAVYDANVLYPYSLRDLLIRLGKTGLFRARWSEQILDEMVSSILQRRGDLTAAKLARTRQLMCDAIPDCLVTGHEQLIDALDLPDPNDRHVLATAIRAGAEVIVTSNLSDFPPEKLEPFNVQAQAPDDFVLHVIDLAPGRVATVVQQMASARVNPAQASEEVLEYLATHGLPRSVAALRSELGS